AAHGVHHMVDVLDTPDLAADAAVRQRTRREQLAASGRCEWQLVVAAGTRAFIDELAQARGESPGRALDALIAHISGGVNLQPGGVLPVVPRAAHELGPRAKARLERRAKAALERVERGAKRAERAA